MIGYRLQVVCASHVSTDTEVIWMKNILSAARCLIQVGFLFSVNITRKCCYKSSKLQKFYIKCIDNTVSQSFHHQNIKSCTRISAHSDYSVLFQGYFQLLAALGCSYGKIVVLVYYKKHLQGLETQEITCLLTFNYSRHLSLTLP